MRIFTKIRQMLFNNTELRLEIEKIKSKINNQTQYIFLIGVLFPRSISRFSLPKSFITLDASLDDFVNTVKNDSFIIIKVAP